MSLATILSQFTFQGLVQISVTSLLLLFVTYSLYLWYLHRKWDAILPGPERASFFSGNLNVISDVASGKDTFPNIIKKNFLVHGKTFKMIIFHRVLVYSVERNVVQELLAGQAHSKDPSFYRNISFPFGARFLGLGLVTESNHEIWAHRRPTIQEAFSRRMLRSYASAMGEEADEMLSRINHKLLESKDGVVNCSDDINWSTFNIIGRTGFSMTTAEIASEGKEILNLTNQLICQIIKSSEAPFMLKYLPWNWRKLFSARRQSGLLRQIIYRRLDARARALVENPSMEVEDLVHHLFMARKDDPSYTIDKMADDMITFYVAGSETTANTLSFSLILLCQHPDILRKLRAEVIEEFGDNRTITFDSVSRLEYMSWFLKEILRMYSPAPGTARVLSYPVRSGKHTIPSGTGVMISFFSSNTLPDSCTHADEFRPERFNPDNDEGLTKPGIYNYMPFSIGPRNCVGQIFAMLEAKIILSKFLLTYDFELPSDYVFKVSQRQVTLRPENGVPLILIKRK